MELDLGVGVSLWSAAKTMVVGVVGDLAARLRCCREGMRSGCQLEERVAYR